MEEIKLIPLKKRGLEIGIYTKCFKKHYDILINYRWTLNVDGYAVTVYQNKNISMHKFIMTIIESNEIPDGYLIDHINTSDPNNRLNNCRDNLRIFTYAQNSKNVRKRKNMTSALLGVSYDKNSKKYRSGIRLNGDNIRFGSFDTDVEAAMARDIYIVQNNLIDEGYPLNFKDKIEEFKNFNTVKKDKKERSSIFNGVRKQNSDSYVSRILYKNKNIFYYRSKDEIECAKKYDEFVVRNKLDKKLNFPNDYPNYIPEKIIKTFKQDINDKICKIKLNSTKETIIDLESYEKIKYYKLSYTKSFNGYERVTIKVDKKIYNLSRYLMNETNIKVLIDHIDSNSLNNSLSNLRRSNIQKNNENRKKHKTENSTNYIGVIKKGVKFITHIQSNRLKYQKSHLTEEYAARDRDLQIMKRLPDSHYKIYFDWSIPGEIEKWEDLLFFEDLDMTVFNF
jgi:hypothetical protein